RLNQFFFSSRRRHTRLQGDWSSDVCSSDLSPAIARASQPRKPSGRSRDASTTLLFATPNRQLSLDEPGARSCRTDTVGLACRIDVAQLAAEREEVADQRRRIVASPDDAARILDRRVGPFT